MLSYFPVAYSDELLYSMIARYAIHTGQTENQKGVLRDVFGVESAIAIPDLPSHLGLLSTRVNHVWQITEDELIKLYTLAPIYLPFLSPEQATLVVTSMYSNQGGNIHTRCGLSASGVHQTKYFRFCPLCAKEQYETLGEPYWQRSHQISGIDVCYHHQCRLVSSKLQFHPQEKHLFQSAYKECADKIVEPVSLTEIEGRLIRLFQELLELHVITGNSTQQWTEFYQKLATESGFKHGCRIDHRAIRQHMNYGWKPTNLDLFLGCETADDWLVHLFRKHRKSFHPLRHLMVWSVLLPDVCVREILSMVGSIPKAAEKTADSTQKRIVKSKSLIQKKRYEWLSLLEKKNGVGIKAIRAEYPGDALYAWFYRNDRQWLMNHRPSKVIQINNHYRADYKKWDDKNLVLLIQCITDYKDKSIRPRLSRTFLIKQLSRSNSVEKHLDDLPKTKKWLIRNAETVENYQLFRIQNVAEMLKRKNIPVKRWLLLRMAGIRFHSVSKKIEEIIHGYETERSID